MEDYSVYNGDGTVLRKAQLHMVDILVEIDRICRKHDIPYWIDFGTLLGAVRHKGFIPWDDDLDISILKKDRNRFCQYISKELPERFFLLDNKSVKYFNKSGIIKVMDRNTRVLENYFDENEIKGDYGVWVDVFCVEKGTSRYRRHINETYGRLIRRMQGNVNDGALNKAIAYILYPFSSLEIMLYRIIRKLSPKDNLIYDLKTLVATALYSERTSKQIFPLKEISFEGHSFLCPNDTDAFLKETYHNYMEIPPAEKRITHLTNIEFYD